MRRILSTFRKNGLFKSDGSLVQREKGKASRTASQRQETFAHQLAGPATASMGRAPRPRCVYGGSDRVNKMTKWELFVIGTLLTLSTAVLLFLSS